jgi:hypothetical protein
MQIIEAASGRIWIVAEVTHHRPGRDMQTQDEAIRRYTEEQSRVDLETAKADAEHPAIAILEKLVEDLGAAEVHRRLGQAEKNVERKRAAAIVHAQWRRDFEDKHPDVVASK